ncbi:MAG TPA: CDP-diacylglycerol--glycerol-3-phosphate 3-phosphatidyltransferase [Kiloniellaceae bacterium]|nr:CDP-diacylglycerol--glycerol-3-phosphate 3-phosphatidyltransferase [Kiloniellaceae bacterium]
MLTSLPNLLTLSRIAAIPLLLILIYFDTPLLRWLALAGYVLACITDYFDGYLARHRNEVSPLGRFLDPIADKLLVASLIVMLVATQQIAGLLVIPAIIILAREILVSGLREYLAEIKVSVPVTALAKWKTTIQMLALGFLIVGDAGPAVIPVQFIGEAGLWIAGVLTAITGYDYLARGLKHMVGEESGSR